MERKPVCPRCGSDKVSCLGSQPTYLSLDDRRSDKPSSMNFAYKCSCGLGFTEMVKREEQASADWDRNLLSDTEQTDCE